MQGVEGVYGNAAHFALFFCTYKTDLKNEVCKIIQILIKKKIKNMLRWQNSMEGPMQDTFQ